MQPTRILPDLQCSLLCEDIRQEASGNFILVGVLAFLRVPQLPITAFKLCVFNRWTAGVGSFAEVVRLVAPDHTTVMRQSKVQFKLQDPTHNATNVTVMGQVEFPSAGVYYLEILVDDLMKLRLPVPVVHVPVPQGHPPEAPGAGN